MSEGFMIARLLAHKFVTLYSLSKAKTMRGSWNSRVDSRTRLFPQVSPKTIYKAINGYQVKEVPWYPIRSPDFPSRSCSASRCTTIGVFEPSSPCWDRCDFNVSLSLYTFDFYIPFTQYITTHASVHSTFYVQRKSTNCSLSWSNVMAVLTSTSLTRLGHWRTKNATRTKTSCCAEPFAISTCLRSPLRTWRTVWFVLHLGCVAWRKNMGWLFWGTINPDIRPFLRFPQHSAKILSQISGSPWIPWINVLGWPNKG